MSDEVPETSESTDAVEGAASNDASDVAAIAGASEVVEIAETAEVAETLLAEPEPEPERSALDAALAYRKAGISVLPIRANGSKAPAISSWKALQQTPAEELVIRLWFREQVGVGIVTGSVSRIEVIDFDWPELFDKWWALVAEIKPRLLEFVAVVQTPKGYGRHVYVPISKPGPNRKLAMRRVQQPDGSWKRETMIETRGEGGYVLAPGCPGACHPSGNRYVHIGGRKIEDLRRNKLPPPLPDEFKLLFECAESFNEDVEPSRLVDQVVVNGTTLSAGMPRTTDADGRVLPGSDFNERASWEEILLPHGWTLVQEDAERKLWRRPGKQGPGISATTGFCAGDLFYAFSTNAAPFEANQAYNKFAAYTILQCGGDFKVAARELRAAGFGSAGSGAPTPGSRERPEGEDNKQLNPKFRALLAEYETFPVGTLPELLRPVVTQVSKSMGCDPGYTALPILAVAAAAIGNTTRIELKRGWTEPSVLWAVLVGRSGQMKSPALDFALKAAQKFQAAALKEFEDTKRKYEGEFARYELEVKSWKKHRCVGDPPEKPKEPVAPRMVCSDATVEAAAMLLRDQPRGLVLGRDELAGWVRGFDQYKQGKGADVTHWLEMHRAGQMIVDRKTANPRLITVPMAALSVAGGVQPMVLKRALEEEHRVNGLAARLLFVNPPRAPKVWTEEDVPPEIEATWEEVLGALYQIPLSLDEDGTPVPRVLRLSPEAKTEWVAFYNELNVAATCMGEDMAAAWSKLEGYTARFALIMEMLGRACGEAAESEFVDVTSMRSGITLAKWFGREAERTYAELNATDEEMTVRARVLLIRRHGGQVTVRSWQRIRSLATSDEAEAELKLLVEQKVADWENVPSGPDGGRPTRLLVLRLAESSDKTPKGEAADGVLSEVGIENGENCISGGAPAEGLLEADEGVFEKEEEGRVQSFGLPSDTTSLDLDTPLEALTSETSFSGTSTGDSDTTPVAVPSEGVLSDGPPLNEGSEPDAGATEPVGDDGWEDAQP
ncbi:MAG: DUF3987 domain-containing protein [Planctomycetaceae bacterium]|nr:DUF3987 domain-containing protein [Planctomycetaceae bacterium]